MIVNILHGVNGVCVMLHVVKLVIEHVNKV